jgi:MEDS: MEthanogen/methylotroph, DcmR Sensory domain
VTISADTQITDLTVNDHACLTFGEPEELFDLTAAFVRDGLDSGLKVMWVSDATPDRATAELARRGIAVEAALASGQLSAVGYEGRLLTGQVFSASQALSWLVHEVEACDSPGLRLAVDMSWALRPVSGVERLPEFEEKVAAAVTGTAVSVLCQYDRERFDPVTLASVAAFHTRSVAAATYHADVMLRICRQYAPPGIRLAGELDYQAQESLALALTEAIRLDGDVTVNMVPLFFIDVTCARMILDAARGLTPKTPPRRMILRSRPGLAARFVLLGAADIPGVSLVSVHDQ